MIADDQLPIDTPPALPPPASPVPAADSPSVRAPLPDDVQPLVIALRPRTGVRRLRGRPTTVPTGHLDVMVDGFQRAWTRGEMGSPIYALAEFLPHEIDQLQAAVQQHRGDRQPPAFCPLPRGTNDEIARLQKM